MSKFPSRFIGPIFFIVLIIASLHFNSNFFSEKKQRIYCDDGIEVKSLSQCPTTTTTLSTDEKLRKCMKSVNVSERDDCLGILALDSEDVEICDRLNDALIMIACYRHFDAKDKIALITTTTSSSITTTTTSTSTSTTTTTLCGNGILDMGEMCDVGTICRQGDGICSLNKVSGSTICLKNSTCEWDIEKFVKKTDIYDLGPCNGCFGPDHELACQCNNERITPQYTTTTRPENTYLMCSGGICTITPGDKPDECWSNRMCFHYSCDSETCKKINTPGNDTCIDNNDCISIWN